jgi:hypothetical protein
MELVTIKDTNNLILKGVNISFEKQDGNVTGVRIEGADGDFVLIRKTSTYNDNLSVLKKAPPKMVTKYLLSGDFHGVKIHQLYDDEWDAKSALANFAASDLSIKEVEVEEGTQNIIAESNFEDVPF